MPSGEHGDVTHLVHLVDQPWCSRCNNADPVMCTRTFKGQDKVCGPRASIVNEDGKVMPPQHLVSTMQGSGTLRHTVLYHCTAQQRLHLACACFLLRVATFRDLPQCMRHSGTRLRPEDLHPQGQMDDMFKLYHKYRGNVSTHN